MGIFDRLKKLLLRRKEKDKLDVEDMTAQLPRAFPEKNDSKPISDKIYKDLDMEPRRKSFDRTIPQKDSEEPSINQISHLKTSMIEEKQDKAEPERISMPEQSTHLAIKQWEDTIKAARQHPLSQAKILNTQILDDLHSVLKSINDRLARLSELDKLDPILRLLRETKDEMANQGINTEQLDNAIDQIDQLTIKDKEVLEWISRQERVTAQQLSDYINLSRSTASFRLNRLADLGALDKEAVGKKIYYKIKTGD